MEACLAPTLGNAGQMVERLPRGVQGTNHHYRDGRERQGKWFLWNLPSICQTPNLLNFDFNVVFFLLGVMDNTATENMFGNVQKAWQTETTVHTCLKTCTIIYLFT